MNSIAGCNRALMPQMFKHRNSSSWALRAAAPKRAVSGGCLKPAFWAIASPETISTTRQEKPPSIAKATYVPSASDALTRRLHATASDRPIAKGTARGAGGPDDHEPVRAPFVIGVCGGTASGKTSVCKRIIELLKADKDLEHQGVVNISQDCFYRDLTAAQAGAISEYNFDHPDAFNFEEICSTLQDLKSGVPVHIPHYDFVTNSRLKDTTYIASADVILFDGIMAFHQEEVRDLFDLKIFVDTDADVRLARRVRRDIVERGRDIIQVLDQYEKTVKPSFESFILPTKKYADVIVPRGADNTAAIDLIHMHVHMQLLARQPSQ